MSTDPATIPATVQQQVAQQRDAIINFLREIVAIPSMESQIGPVGERVQAEMAKLGFSDSPLRQHGQHARTHRRRAADAAL